MYVNFLGRPSVWLGPETTLAATWLVMCGVLQRVFIRDSISRSCLPNFVFCVALIFIYFLFYFILDRSGSQGRNVFERQNQGGG